MAAAPEFKVYDAAGKYQAACKEIEAAAALVAFYGEGATIRHRHHMIAWTEGQDGNAAESYDSVAQFVTDRLIKAYNPPRELDYRETLWHPLG